MVDHPVLGILGVLAALGFSMAGLRWWQTRRAVAPETVRKALHGLMGGVALTLPWVFEALWPVAVLAGLSVALMLAVRRVPLLRRHVGGVLHGVGRRSYGEVCFPVAVCALFALSGGGGLSYTIPLLLLTLADSAAALVGVRLGRMRYATLDGFKSGEGSLAFFLVALPCVLVPLLASGTSLAASLLMALTVGAVTTLVEASSWRGLDNLFVPLGGFALLHFSPSYDLEVFVVRTLIAGL